MLFSILLDSTVAGGGKTRRFRLYVPSEQFTMKIKMRTQVCSHNLPMDTKESGQSNRPFFDLLPVVNVEQIIDTAVHTL